MRVYLNVDQVDDVTAVQVADEIQVRVSTPDGQLVATATPDEWHALLNRIDRAVDDAYKAGA